MTERRCPTTEQVQIMIDAVRVNVKSGIVAAGAGGNSVTFNTPFASVPRVVLTVQDAGPPLRDCLYKVTAVSETGFSFEADVAATYAWIATDAGDP